MDRVVVLAFGPRRTSKQAVERSKRLGLPVTVVPGLRDAGRGLGALRSRVVDVVAATGTAGLEEALQPLRPDELVLLLHDDVLISGESVAALEALHEEVGGIVVPGTNEPDADAYVGSLAPDVEPGLRDEDDAPVRAARASCLVADVATVRALLVRRVAAAETLFSLPSGVLTASGAATAVHLDTCRDQLPAPEGPDGRPLLVAALIVRDEQDFLADCLASLDGVVDRIEVCDTGSADDTVAVAQAAGAHVIHREWRDDFAWARNEVLDQCRDAWWVLSIDADERLLVDDPVALRRTLAASIGEVVAFQLAFHDVLDEDTVVPGQHVPRVFPSTSTWVGQLHEVPHRADGGRHRWTIVESATIEHHGYRPEVIAGRDKGARNVALGRAQYQREPSLEHAYQLARSLQVASPGLVMVDEAVELLQEVVAGTESTSGGLDARARADVRRMLALHHLHSHDHETALRLAEESLSLLPDEPRALAILAQAGVATGDFDRVIAADAELDDRALDRVVQPAVELQRLVAVAKAHLGREDVEGAGNVVDRMLDGALPALYDEWDDVASLVAITRAELADELLLPWSVRDPSAGLLRAVVKLFHPEDAAEFGLRVVELSAHDDASRAGKAMVALAVTVVADRPDLARRLLATGLVPDEYVGRMADHAVETERPAVAAVLAEAVGAAGQPSS